MILWCGRLRHLRNRRSRTHETSAGLEHPSGPAERPRKPCPKLATGTGPIANNLRRSGEVRAAPKAPISHDSPVTLPAICLVRAPVITKSAWHNLHLVNVVRHRPGVWLPGRGQARPAAAFLGEGANAANPGHVQEARAEYGQMEAHVKAKIKPRINLEGRTALETVIPLATPFVVFVDPASACNFQCPFCPTGHRDMIRDTGRYQGAMKYDVFTKIVDDLAAFESPIKVLRLYKDGEPFLNKRLADMIAYAKASGHIEYIDTTTNGSFLSPEVLGPVLEAGLDKINVSVDGMNDAQYKQFTGYDFDFARFVENVKWLYKNRGTCEVFVKIPGELISEAQKQEFYDTFGDHCDRIFIENFAPCWPEFDVEAHTSVTIKEGIYQQPVTATNTCPYIFYGYSVNADGLVSSCFLDWGRKLIIGDVRKQSMKEIWNSDAMNALRLQHLQGKRCENGVCGSCGQLSHCLPDNIDAHVPMLLKRFTDRVALNADVPAPGGVAKPPLVQAAE